MLCNARPMSSMALQPLKRFGRKKDALVSICSPVFRRTLILKIRQPDEPDRSMVYQSAGLTADSLFRQPKEFLSTSLKDAFADLPEQNLASKEKVEKEKTEKASHKKTEVTFEEVVALIESGSIFLYDVREPQEIEETGMLPKAVNISLTKLKASLQLEPELFQEQFSSPKPTKEEAHVVFYGLSSVKGTAAVEIAHKLGFKKARQYPGGWEEWSQKKNAKT